MTSLPDQADRILRERAAALARPVEDAPRLGAPVEILVLSVGAERYGIEVCHVVEVFAPREVTPVPCTPPFILGVLNHRGRVLAVLDLRRLFELPADDPAEAGRVVAVQAGGMAFGLGGDAVAGPIAIDAGTLAPPPASLALDRVARVRGVTPEMVTVLDLDALAADPRLQVNDEAD